MNDTTNIYTFNTWRISNGLEPLKIDDHEWSGTTETTEAK